MKEFATILLLLVASTTVCVTEAVYLQSLYKGVKLGRNITGKIGAEFRSRSNVECSSRYSHIIHIRVFFHRLIQPNYIYKKMRDLTKD